MSSKVSKVNEFENDLGAVFAKRFVNRGLVEEGSMREEFMQAPRTRAGAPNRHALL